MMEAEASSSGWGRRKTANFVVATNESRQELVADVLFCKYNPSRSRKDIALLILRVILFLNKNDIENCQ
mgnify:CR=1 FL=1